MLRQVPAGFWFLETPAWLFAIDVIHLPYILSTRKTTTDMGDLSIHPKLAQDLIMLVDKALRTLFTSFPKFLKVPNSWYEYYFFFVLTVRWTCAFVRINAHEIIAQWIELCINMKVWAVNQLLRIGPQGYMILPTILMIVHIFSAHRWSQRKVKLAVTQLNNCAIYQ